MATTSSSEKAVSIYDFKVPGLSGQEIDFAHFKGKKILVVNTASACGYTAQYEELEQLHQKYRDTLAVVGFPANNFGAQEPGTNAEIKEFCSSNYGVSFNLAEKLSVAGADIHPLFQHLTEEATTTLGSPDPVIKWNFTKFLIDEEGKLINLFPSRVKPLDEEITVHL